VTVVSDNHVIHTAPTILFKFIFEPNAPPSTVTFEDIKALLAEKQNSKYYARARFINNLYWSLQAGHVLSVDSVGCTSVKSRKLSPSMTIF
jgi:hypothetical protein